MLNRLDLNGAGIELGVAAARFSVVILNKSKLKILYGVDIWSPHRLGRRKSRSHDEKEYKKVCKIAKTWGKRFVVIRRTFNEALDLFEDNYFDFIFVDGLAHTGKNGKTMGAWWPKLKKGGIMAVHDYTPLFPANVKAIKRFARKHNASGYLTKNDSKPSWVTLKE